MRQVRTRRASAGGLGVLVAVVTLIVAGCIPSGPTYPIDFYHEMHYNQNFRPGEPPVLSPPDGAVPITGPTTAALAVVPADMTNPLPASQQVIDRGHEVFRVNCQACHGVNADGQGIIASYFQAANTRVPANLRVAPTSARTDAELYTIITQGTGQLQRGAGVMPPFGKLLSNDDVWAVIAYLRSLQGSAAAESASQ